MKIKHIRKSADFAELTRNGGKIKESSLTVFFRRHCSPGSLAVGLIVSKKTEPLATVRNYIRRVVYAICSEKASRFDKKTDIVVRIDGKNKASGRKELYGWLRKDLGKALERIKE